MIRGINSNLNSIQIETNNTKRKSQTQNVNKTSRVEEIKKAIENGTYKIDIEKTAKAMAKSLL